LKFSLGAEEPHHRYARLAIAIATLQSAEAELVIIDWNWCAPSPPYSGEPARTFHGKPLATPGDWWMMAP